MSKAVEKFAEMLKSESAMGDDPVLSHIWVIDKILNAIRANPLDYIKPKPLEWETSILGGWNGDQISHVGFGFMYRISLHPESIVQGEDLFVLEKHESSGVTKSPQHTLEDAQAAAYDDLCKRIKELF